MKYQILITSVPDRENLVAEIWDGKNLLAEINQDEGLLEIEIYFKDQSIIVEFDSFLEALKQGQSKLLSE